MIVFITKISGLNREGFRGKGVQEEQHKRYKTQEAPGVLSGASRVLFLTMDHGLLTMDFTLWELNARVGGNVGFRDI